jgi:hypothetical protein
MAADGIIDRANGSIKINHLSDLRVLANGNIYE